LAEPVGVGVIGVGYWGTKLTGEYLAAQQSKRNVKLVKVCDQSLQALLECERRFSLHYSKLTRRVEDVLADERISALHIATPNYTHYKLAKLALEAGKDVLVEKPMTLSSSEAYELVDIASSLGRVLHVGHIFRYNSALRSACQVLCDRRLGRIFYARVQWTDYLPPFPDRDIVFDLGPHPVDILNLLLQDWPAQVSGFGRGYRGAGDREEVAYGIAEFHDGVFAHIELSWLHPRKVREVTIVGSEGTLVVDCVGQKVAIVKERNSVELPISVNNTIESEINHFIDCVLRRDTSTDSGLVGAQTVEVLETIRASIWNRPVPPPRQLPVEGEENIVTILGRLNSKASSNAFAENGAATDGMTEKYLEILERAGLLRTNGTPEGVRYEVTETGAQFLKEYQDAMSGSRKEAAKAQQV
jgi:predicted dehydrogenase